MFKPFKYILLFIFITSTTAVFAQRDTLTQEVEVTKAYKPTINDANKLNSMPKIEETEFKKPTFNYSITSQPVFSTFSVNPLKAATIETALPKEKSYGLVRAGLGNYYKPYGEVFFNNVNSKNSVIGIRAMHLSSYGDVKLEGGNKVDAPFMKNEIEMYVKHIYQNSVLAVNFDFKNNGFNYYGYPLNPVPDFLLEDGQNINYFGTKQAFNKAGFTIGLKNPTAEMDEKAFGFNFDYHYFGTKTEQKEHFANFTANIRSPFQIGVGLLDAGVQYTTVDNITPHNDSIMGNNAETWIFIKPAWYIGTREANLTIGVKAWFVVISDEDTQAKIAPNIRANWSPVKEIINIFAGIDGNYQSNHYSAVAYENQFINPDHDIKNSFQKLRFFGGFDGKFSKKTNFKFAAEYSKTDDKVLYYLHENFYLDPAYNPAPLVIDNTFSAFYDNMDRLKLSAEIFYASSDKMDLLASVNYYSYSLTEQTEAWNLPQWDAKFSIGYKVNEQLSLSADFFLIGQRKALIVEEPSVLSSTGPIYKSNTLDTAFDLNAKGNYQINHKFSVFAQLNNFGFQKYQQWFGYPVQSFNLLAGVSYAF